MGLQAEPPARQCPPHLILCCIPAALASHDYILKIVPTVYEDKSGKQRYSYQYTVANKVSGSAVNGLSIAIAPSAGQGHRRCPAHSAEGNFSGVDRECPGSFSSLSKDEIPVLAVVVASRSR